ncbi:hypothetical protein [Acinetobacter sp. YH1901134]|uniref:hypothetical protein n=1 Tax=Acinetobacter sp. YH1901134 TaxID=2601199 RepID=UPI0015D46804|nr:hypothetical protein [Acinetobacter sp. YH1901134]
MKIKYILACIFLLVVGLIFGFFIGFGVTNKELDVDWKAIAPIISGLMASTIAALTALYISNKWGKQKGGEVIATESKQAIKDILELVKIINYFDKGVVNEDDLNEEFKKFANGYDFIVINVAFIEDCLVDNNLKTSFDEFTISSLRVKSLISYENKRPGDKVLSNAIREFNNEAIKLVNSLNPYSTYRKECKFKLKN